MSKKFKITLAVILALGVGWFGADAKADGGPATNGLQMAIKLEAGPSITAGQSCRLMFSYRNLTTNETFAIYEAVDDPSYSFAITSPSGKDVSPDLSKFMCPFSGVFRYVNAGQTVQIKFDLGKFCTFAEVGAYKIVAKKTDIISIAGNKQFAATSNPLTVTVVPAAPTEALDASQREQLYQIKVKYHLFEISVMKNEIFIGSNGRLPTNIESEITKVVGKGYKFDYEVD